MWYYNYNRGDSVLCHLYTVQMFDFRIDNYYIGLHGCRSVQSVNGNVIDPVCLKLCAIHVHHKDLPLYTSISLNSLR